MGAPMKTSPSSLSVSGKDPLEGHLNHLTTEQAEAFALMKQQLAEGGNIELEPLSIDEAILLRFLRARKFDVAGGCEQFVNTQHWRKDRNVAAIYDDIEIDDFVTTTQVHPQWTGRHDLTGKPIYIYKISALTKEVIHEYDKAGSDVLETRMIALYEHMVQFSLPFATALPRDGIYATAPVSSTITIVDVSSVSLSRFWSLRAHMQAASVLASANYAETLGRIIIVGAPKFFSVVWGWISRWFDPATIAKIVIVSDAELLSTLSKFIAIENIPKVYGGELDFEYSVTKPTLSDAGKDLISLDHLPEGPIRWIDGHVVLKGAGRSSTEEAELANALEVKELKSVSSSIGTDSSLLEEKHGDVVDTVTAQLATTTVA